MLAHEQVCFVVFFQILCHIIQISLTLLKFVKMQHFYIDHFKFNNSTVFILLTLSPFCVLNSSNMDSNLK